MTTPISSRVGPRNKKYMSLVTTYAIPVRQPILILSNAYSGRAYIKDSGEKQV